MNKISKFKIEEIHDPKFLKYLTIKELEQLANDIREFLIENVSKTGGHISSNLGAVELTLALHYVFDSPVDKLIFDVGHQAYVHKILTGRAKEFTTLRQYKGLSGFLKMSESEHDVWEAGHSSTSISAAAGFLEAKELSNEIGEVVSIIGDGSIQNGLAFSGLNYLGTKSNQKLIVILNDNNMSISPNVGVVGKSFDKIRIKKSYSFFRRLVPKFIGKLFRRFKRAITAFFHGNNLMEAFGLRYFGPIDGHNLKELIKYFTYAKNSKSSILIHLNTLKGKGYKFAEEDNLGLWHGVAPFDIATGEALNNGETGKVNWSQGIGNLLLSEAKKNEKVRVISPAMIQGSGLLEFEKTLPKQLIDVGIAEEHSVVMASAMAQNGLLPVVVIYSTFLQRAYDQLNHDVTRTNANVLFLIDRSGIVGEDGETHQGLFDVSFLSSLPNMVITMPKNLNEAKALIDYGLNKHNGPFAIRYPRGKTSEEVITEEIEFGKWKIELPLEKTNIIAYGPAVEQFKTEIIKSNKKIGLINALFIKPYDSELLKQLDYTELIVYEEVIQSGSLVSSIYTFVNESNLNIKIDSYSIKDIYVEQGNTEIVRSKLGLDIKEIIKNKG